MTASIASQVDTVRPLNQDREPSSFWSTVGDMSSLALTLALCVFFGFFAGKWIGKRYGHEDIGILGGMAVGITAAGVELARSVKRLNRLGSRKPVSPRKGRSDDESSDER